jgi:glycosyltransferase involved in cell wall biosynthesis
VDVVRFAPPDRVRPAYRLRLLSVGRLVRQKGLAYAIAALAQSQTSAVLRIVGDGPERPALERQTAALGLGHRVEFTGWAERAALPAHYQWADALLLPSLEEGMANVLLEALASGLPAVASDIYGNRELVEPGHNGFLVPPEDPAAIASAISALAGDTALVRGLGENSRQAALALSWTSVAHGYRSRMAAGLGDAVSLANMPPEHTSLAGDTSTVATEVAQTVACQNTTRA